MGVLKLCALNSRAPACPLDDLERNIFLVVHGGGSRLNESLNAKRLPRLAVLDVGVLLNACALKCVIEQNCEHKANGHAGQGFQDEFKDGFEGHGIGMIKTFAPGFKRWIAAST